MPTFSASAPSSTDVFEASKLKWPKLGYPEPSALDELLAAAIAYVSTITGRFYDDWPAPGGQEGTAALVGTPNLIPLFNRAVRMRVEQEAKQDQPGYIDTATDDVTQSISAGPYSETRRDPTRRGEEKIINLWPELNTLLWMLMTDDRRDYWTALLSGKNAPAFEVTEVEWGLIGTPFPFGTTAPVGALDPYAPWTMWIP